MSPYVSDLSKEILRMCIRTDYMKRASYSKLLNISPFYEMNRNEIFHFSIEDDIFYETLKTETTEIKPLIMTA